MTELRLTVLGASPAWANPGWACSGYLVSGSGTNLLLDCGFGVASRLRKALPFEELGAIFISHMHPDHFMDLVSLRYGLKYGGLREDPELPLFVPPGGRDYLRKLGEAIDGDSRFFDGTFRLSEYNPDGTTEVHGLRVQFTAVKHYIPAFAMSITGHRRLVFSGDAAPCSSLVEIARDADLFLCEAAINGHHEDDPEPSRRGHMTAREAAEIAERAQARRLLLTHYRWQPDQLETHRREAADAYSGPFEFVREGNVYTV